MAYEFIEKAWKGLGKGYALGFCIIAFMMLALIKLHPGIVVACFLAYGAFHFKWVSRSKKSTPGKDISS